MRDRDQPRARSDRIGDLRERRDPDVNAGAPQPSERSQQSWVLLVGGDDMVTGSQLEPRQDGVTAVGGRAGKRDVGGIGVQDPRVAGPQLAGEPPHGLHVRLAGAALA